MKRALFLVIVIFLSVYNFQVMSQSDDKNIYVSIQGAHNFNNNEFHKFWKPGIGLGGSFTFDHKIGKLGIGIELMEFQRRNISSKDFLGIDYHLLYSNTIHLFRFINLHIGAGAGIYEFRFDDDEDIKSEAEKTEREFAIKIISGLSFDISPEWSTGLNLVYTHIYTRRKIELLNISAGIRKSFSTPEWLKEILE